MKVNSSAVVPGLNANLLNGKGSGQFLGTFTYRREAPTDLGTLLGDGSRVKTATCDVGDKLISGGPASVDAGSKVLDDFPINTFQWQARILPHAAGDNWTVVVLCSTCLSGVALRTTGKLEFRTGAACDRGVRRQV